MKDAKDDRAAGKRRTGEKGRDKGKGKAATPKKEGVKKVAAKSKGGAKKAAKPEEADPAKKTGAKAPRKPSKKTTPVKAPTSRTTRSAPVEPTDSWVKVASDHLPRHAAFASKVEPQEFEPGEEGPKRVKGEPKKRSTKRIPIRVGGHRVAKGTKENILLKISEHYTHQGVYIPVTVIRGKKPGPRLFLTAAVHGDEVNGVQIIRELLDQVEPQDMRGTLVAVPVVNRFGFVSHSRYMPDRRDLNRGFPGDPNGSTTARVARIVYDEIVRPCDYGIDLHTAGYQRANLPQIRGDMEDDEVRRIAKAFGAEVILDNKGLKGTLRRVATENGVPTIIYEAGETFRFQRDMITKGVTGILNVMRELGMIKEPLDRPEFQVIVKSSEWVRADHGGILETLIEPGSLVYKEDIIARISNPFGRTVAEVTAPFNGLVVGTTTLPMVNPGAPICHVVKLKKTLKTVAHHKRRAIPPEITRKVLEHLEPADVTKVFEEEDVEG